MENTNFKVYIEKTTQDYGCLYIEPLERGYGDTLGNALRRLLLSSIKGVAVTAVRIDGVLHEFSTIPGVREDVIEILMNLKHIPIKAKTEKPQLKPEGYKLVTLDSDELPKDFFTRTENPGVITAKELPWDSDFEFCGDGVLCTLEPGAHLVMEICIEPGVGYLSAEREKPAYLPLDALLTDAIFSPVKRVNYQIGPARVGQSIDYERLVIDVWTNGAVSPKDSVEEAAKIATVYFGHLADSVKGASTVEKAKPESSEIPQVKPRLGAIEDDHDSDEAVDVLPPKKDDERPISVLELSLRSEHCLQKEGIETIGQLLLRSHDDLLKIRNFGKKSLVEIEEKLALHDLQLSPSSMSQDDDSFSELESESESEYKYEKDSDDDAVVEVEPEGEADAKPEADEQVQIETAKSKKASSKSKSAADSNVNEADKEKPEKPKKTKKAAKNTKEAEAPNTTDENDN